MNKISTAAAELGRKGGKARAKKMTKAERSEACRKAVNERWRKWRLKHEKSQDDAVSVDSGS
jgi:hypothetical protein